MAPRKRGPIRDKKVAMPLAPKPTRVTKAKTALAAPTTTRRSSRLMEKPSTVTVQRQKNGLLDLRRTPSHLVGTVKLNSTASPLLRLPPELRHKIWVFSMGISNVRIIIDSEDRRLKGYTVDMRKPVLTERDTAPEYPYSKYRRGKVPLAFHLPEVCRQIYSETAVLVYKLNTFIVQSDFDDYHCPWWASKLLPAQRNVINYIVISAEFLRCHILMKDMPALKKGAHAPLQNLRHIRIPCEAWKQVLHENETDWLRFPDLTRDQCKPWIVTKLKEKEGVDVEFEFEEEE